MKRETTNKIRFVLEDIVPPILRDSRLFKAVAKLAWGKHIGCLLYTSPSPRDRG